jgi:hypothetical protein
MCVHSKLEIAVCIALSVTLTVNCCNSQRLDVDSYKRIINIVKFNKFQKMTANASQSTILVYYMVKQKIFFLFDLIRRSEKEKN